MEFVQNILKIVASIWDQVQAAPSHLLLIAVLFVIGLFLKSSPIKNAFIPHIIFALGTVVYPLLVSPTNVRPELQSPRLVLALYGLLLAAITIGLHAFASKSEKFCEWEENFVNAFARKTKNQQPKNESEEKQVPDVRRPD
jgi:hypothetical protein